MQISWRDRAGFTLTVAAILGTCAALAWQNYSGPGAEQISGFLCVLWALLMVTRLMNLTAFTIRPHKKHLADKILAALYRQKEKENAVILQTAMGPAYVAFLMGGALFLAWQLACVFLPTDTAYHAAPVQDFLAALGVIPSFKAPLLFDWGQSFLLALMLAMAGFMLRSYAQHKAMVRVVLLLFTAYVASFWFVFYDVSAQASGQILLQQILEGSGLFGLSLLSFLLFVPIGFIGVSLHQKHRDGIITASGLIAAGALAGSVVFADHPALTGYLFLCWMALFLAWGACEQNTAVPKSLTKEQR